MDLSFDWLRLDIHPWIALTFVLTQFVFTILSLEHGKLYSLAIWQTLLMTVLACLLPIAAIQGSLYLIDPKEYRDIIILLFIFYLFVLFVPFGVFAVYREQLIFLNVWFWFFIVCWLAIFLISGGVFMIISPISLGLFLLIRFLYRRTVKHLPIDASLIHEESSDGPEIWDRH